MRCFRIPALAAVIPAVLMACSVEPPEQQSTPVAPSLAVADAVTLPGAFYPLLVGNQWTYRRVVSLGVIPDTGPAAPPEVTIDTMTRRQTGISGEESPQYIYEHDYVGPFPYSVRMYRQDRNGLYQGALPYRSLSAVDAGSQRPGTALASAAAARWGVDPSCLAGLMRRHAEVVALATGAAPGDGLLPGELLRLAYPLHAGATWVVVADPLVVSTVEGVDQIAGSPAYRIRIDNELMGPDDQVHLWFGRCGFVSMHARLEAVATDENGERIGVAVSEETWELQSTDIDRGGCEVGADNGVVGGKINAYPLAVGNHWTYRIVDRQPLVWYDTVVIADQEQVATVDIEGRSYIKEVMTARAPATWTSVSYLRQDHEGLYSMNPPGFAVRSTRETVRSLVRTAVSGGEPGEATELVYPLRVGQTWTIRDDAVLGLWTATVEARERLSLLVGEYDAFRIRIERNTAPEGSELFVWYGSAGVLKVFARVHTIDGYSTEEWTLEEVDLAR